MPLNQDQDLLADLSIAICSSCLWMSGGVSIDLGDIFGMPELLGSVFGDSLHEGLAQTGASSLFWPNPKRQEFFTYLF